jgi:hypothetical protein
MILKRENARGSDKWEAVLVFFGFIEVYEKFPNLFRELGLFKLIILLIPECVTKVLTQLNTNTNFWLAWLFLIITVLVIKGIGINFFPTQKPIEEDYKSDISEKVLSNIKTSEKKLKFKKWIFSCGLVPLREFILEKMGIILCGTFKRPKEWPTNEKFFDSINRL